MGSLTDLADQIEGRLGPGIMVEDGLPPEAAISPEERKEAWKGRKLTKPRDLKVPAKDEDASTKKLRKELAAAAVQKMAERFARLNELKQEKEKAMTKITPKADQVKELRQRRAAQKGAGASKPKAAAKKAANAKARTPAGPKPMAGASKTIRPGSKLEIIVGLLTRKEGCTTSDILKAVEWPAVSVPQMARSAGLKLRKEKDGSVTRYYGTAA